MNRYAAILVSVALVTEWRQISQAKSDAEHSNQRIGSRINEHHANHATQRHTGGGRRGHKQVARNLTGHGEGIFLFSLQNSVVDVPMPWGNMSMPAKSYFDGFGGLIFKLFSLVLSETIFRRSGGHVEVEPSSITGQSWRASVAIESSRDYTSTVRYYTRRWYWQNSWAHSSFKIDC